MQGTYMLICPVCGSKKWAKRYRIGSWDIEECVVCSFAKIDPLPPEEARAGHYSEDMVCERNVKQRSALRNFVKNAKHFFKNMISRDKSAVFYAKLCKYLSPCSRILDVGCGDATFLNLAKKRFVCTGIEVSDYLVSHARKKDGIDIIEGDFLKADFKDNKYNGIILIALLEHLDKPLEALKKCFDLLNSKGILLLKTVNYNSLNRRITKAGWVGFRPPDHIVYFNPANLKAILRKIGFSKINISALPFGDNMYCEAIK